MICDKHCPMLDKNGDCMKPDLECDLRDRGSICGDCIHDYVCGMEGHLDPAMTFCAEKVGTDVVAMLSRVNGLRLSDLIPVLDTTPWFSVVMETGETNAQVTYTYPERFLVHKISFDTAEKKIVIIVTEDK